MTLRFEVDQAECMRRGIDCPKSVITVSVTPSTLPQTERDLLADRMDGIDVQRLCVDIKRAEPGSYALGHAAPIVGWKRGRIHFETGKIRDGYPEYRCVLIMAKAPTYEALIEACKQNEAELVQEVKQLKEENPEIKS